jgi:hypothetical protein
MMLRRMIVTAVSLLAIQHGGAASAQQQLYPQFFSGNQLLNDCADANNQRCTVYIEGVFDALSAAQHFVQLWALKRVCIAFPIGASGQQVRDIVTWWLQANPAMRHEGAGGLVRTALSEAWPCP